MTVVQEKEATALVSEGTAAEQVEAAATPESVDAAAVVGMEDALLCRGHAGLSDRNTEEEEYSDEFEEEEEAVGEDSDDEDMFENDDLNVRGAAQMHQAKCEETAIDDVNYLSLSQRDVESRASEPLSANDSEHDELSLHQNTKELTGKRGTEAEVVHAEEGPMSPSGSPDASSNVTHAVRNCSNTEDMVRQSIWDVSENDAAEMPEIGPKFMPFCVDPLDQCFQNWTPSGSAKVYSIAGEQLSRLDCLQNIVRKCTPTDAGWWIAAALLQGDVTVHGNAYTATQCAEEVGGSLRVPTEAVLSRADRCMQQQLTWLFCRHFDAIVATARCEHAMLCRLVSVFASCAGVPCGDQLQLS